ncbi:flagellar biosynthesis protein FlhF [Desulfurobacterium crinifex]
MKVKTYRGKSLQEIISVLNEEYENSYAILSVNQKLKWRFFLFPKREVEVVVGIEEKITKKEETSEVSLPSFPLTESKKTSNGAIEKFLVDVRKPSPVGEGKPLVFFGPTGSGKTTHIGKTYIDLLNNSIEDIAVISLDTFRLGAIEQLKIFCSVVDTPFQIAYEPDEFRDIVELLSEHKVILVDTPGVSISSESIEELVKFLRATETINILTIDASRDIDVLEKYFEAFNSLLNGIAVTKLDEIDEKKVELIRELIGDIPVYSVSYRQNLTEGFKRLWQ